MNPSPTARRAAARSDGPPRPPAPPVERPPRAGRFRRLAARVGAAVRTAHSTGVPF